MMNRGPVSRVEPLDSQFVKAANRLRECNAIPTREIEPSESSIGKHGITRNQEVLLLQIQADASRGVSRGMEDSQGSDAVSFGENPLCSDAGGSCAKMEGEAQMILEKPGGVEMMDGNACVTHMRYLLQMCGVIIMAVREHDGIDIPPIGFDLRGKDSGIDKNSADKVGIRRKPSSRDPRDWHA